MDTHGKPVEGTPKNWLQYYISESNNNIDGKEQVHPGIQEVKPVETETVKPVTEKKKEVDESENVNLKKRTSKKEVVVEVEEVEEIEEVKPKKKSKVAKKPKSDTEEEVEEEVVKPKKKAKSAKKSKPEPEQEEDE